MRRLRTMVIALSVVLASSIAARDTRKEVTLTLKFVPQEGVQTTSPNLLPDLLTKSIDLRVEDGRKLADPLVVGQGTNDDDQSFPVRAASDVVAYVDATVKGIAKDWSIATGGTDRVLTISLTRFNVDESNKAVGSVYTADVKLAFTLTDGKGAVLARGIGAGEAHRYGRARSADNCNEVLSDALKEAFSNVVSDSALQTAWMSGKAADGAQGTAATPKESAEERLKKLDDLYKKGLITKEEYERKRAEILKEL